MDCLALNTLEPFNRTILELKQGGGTSSQFLKAAFNRTILELKPHTKTRKNLKPGTFNRTILELKLDILYTQKSMEYTF